jgi:hypothetical protein
MRSLPSKGKSINLHAAADLAFSTTTHADGLSGHLLSRTLNNMLIRNPIGVALRTGRAYRLLGSTSGWELHLLGLRLLDFLGRHVCKMCDSE